MKVEYINPFLVSSVDIFKQVCHLDIDIENSKRKLFIKTLPTIPDEVRLTIGITGDIKGNVSLNMNKETALFIASCMLKSMMGMDMQFTELDDMVRSTISELGNMIAGNSSSVFYSMSKSINITPPMLMIENTGKIYQDKTLCVPLFIGEHKIEIDVSIKD